MRLYDTLSAAETALEFADGTAKIYVCGITPYDTSHMGHARVAVVFDTLRRYLTWRGVQVQYVQNITDIDDPLFERAKRDGVDWRTLGDQQTARYLESLALLNVAQPDHYIKATAEIDAMLPIIARLIALGHAYAVDGSVYYRVASKDDFGAIAHSDRATMLATANEMGNNPDDPKKHDPLDFVLWQPSAPDEPAWDSPWGPGRPGWHIECSTIATRYLGPQLDIHGGGSDLIFPHHACEIAQAEPVTGVVPFARAWMHIGMVTLGGIKMSKSLGNMVFVKDVLRDHSANALRVALLRQPYRSLYEYTEADVQAAEDDMDAIKEALTAHSADQGVGIEGVEVRERFTRAMDSDLDTPAALSMLVSLADTIGHAADVGRGVRAGQDTLRDLAGVMGLVV